VRVRLGELPQDLLARLAQRPSSELLVEVVRGALELIGREAALELDDAVLHLAVVEDEHYQHPVLGQRHEFDLGDRGRAGARQGDDAGEPGRAREQLRDGRNQVGGAVATRLDLAADLGGRRLIERTQLQQRIDEEAVTLVGRHPAGGGMGRGDEAELLEIRHHVADRSRGKLQARFARQGTRADRLAVADVGLDQDPQQVLCPLA
jgi:hypothetical protein